MNEDEIRNLNDTLKAMSSIYSGNLTAEAAEMYVMLLSQYEYTRVQEAIDWLTAEYVYHTMPTPAQIVEYVEMVPVKITYNENQIKQEQHVLTFHDRLYKILIARYTTFTVTKQIPFNFKDLIRFCEKVTNGYFVGEKYNKAVLTIDNLDKLNLRIKKEEKGNDWMVDQMHELFGGFNIEILKATATPKNWKKMKERFKLSEPEMEPVITSTDGDQANV